jgi:transposase, IS5 family
VYLKHRYQLGSESLGREVADSIGWRRFCRIGLDRPVPHPTTLVKLVGRVGPEVIQELNAALVDKLTGDRLLRAGRLRVDPPWWRSTSTTRPTPTCWSTRCASLVGWSPGQGPWGGQPDPVAGPGSGGWAADEAAGPDAAPAHPGGDGRGGSAHREVARLARQSLGEVRAVLRNARRALARRPGDGRRTRLVGELDETISQTQRLLAQTDSGFRATG